MKTLFTFLVIAFLCAPLCADCRKPAIMTDEELDGVSAAGFDIDLPAVAALRQTIAASSSAVSQLNFAAALASQGNIAGTSISNANHAQLSVSAANQLNVAALVALKGSIHDSTISNVNSAAAGSNAAVQHNFAIMLASSTIENCSILNTNVLNPAATFSVENYVLNGINGIKSIQAGISGSADQKNVGILISLKGEIKSCVIQNTNN